MASYSRVPSVASYSSGVTAVPFARAVSSLSMAVTVVRGRAGGRVVDQVRDLPQPQAQAPVGQHLPQPFHVAGGVGPVPGRCPRGRPDEADRVVVVQRAGGDAGQLGHAPHGQVLFHADDYAA
jgi:hypothetical protein